MVSWVQKQVNRSNTSRFIASSFALTPRAIFPTSSTSFSIRFLMADTKKGKKEEKTKKIKTQVIKGLIYLSLSPFSFARDRMVAETGLLRSDMQLINESTFTIYMYSMFFPVPNAIGSGLRRNLSSKRENLMIYYVKY